MQLFSRKCLGLIETDRRAALAKADAGSGEDWDFEARIGFAPDPIQKQILSSGAHQLILNCTRQWGKSTLVAAKAVQVAYTRPGSLVVVVTPGERQRGEFLMKAETFVAALGIRPRGDGYNKLSIALPNGSRMVGLPGTERTVRGFSAVTFMVIDEAARVTDDQFHAVTPMLAVSNGEWLVASG